jgi:aspartyl-tRNA synthetase
VALAGWVNRRRDLGNLIFLDLRDRHGITQVAVDAAEAAAAHAAASEVRSEFVVRVEGTVARRVLPRSLRATHGVRWPTRRRATTPSVLNRRWRLQFGRAA